MISVTPAINGCATNRNTGPDPIPAGSSARLALKRDKKPNAIN